MSWFRTWFDSKYYHILYQDRNDYEAEFFINNLINYLEIKKGCKIIDIACGKGRHSKYLNAQGFYVTGIDLSENSIKIAKQHENNLLKFSVHDMREPFKKRYFDLSLNLFTSFGYFSDPEDDKRSMRSTITNLKKEGVLVIDFMNTTKVIRKLIKSEQKTIDGITFKIRKKLEKRFLYKTIDIFDKEVYRFQERVRLLTLDDFSILLNQSGAQIINIFGNYKLEEFNVSTSDRLIIIAKK